MQPASNSETAHANYANPTAGRRTAVNPNYAASHVYGWVETRNVSVSDSDLIFSARCTFFEDLKMCSAMAKKVNYRNTRKSNPFHGFLN